jgi:hypothetical protein
VATGSLWCLFSLLLRTIVAPYLWFVHIGTFASTGPWTPVSGPRSLGLVCNVFICTHLHIWLLFKEMDQAWCIVMLQPLGMNQAQKKEKGLWGSKLALLVTLRWLNWSVMLY